MIVITACRRLRGSPPALGRAASIVALALSLLTLPFASGDARAQTVAGTVLDAASGAPVYTADLRLLDADGHVVARSVTDEHGRFAVAVPRAGVFQLVVERLGYAPFTTDVFALELEQNARAEIRLEPSPIPLEPLEAIVEGRRPRRLVRVGFYRRQERGFGYFRTPEEVEALHPLFPEDLFRGIPGVRVVSGGALLSTRGVMRLLSQRMGCPLAVAVDGLIVSGWTEVVHVNDIEAVEVYPSPAGLPAWAFGTRSRCGAVLIWTKGSLR